MPEFVQTAFLAGLAALAVPVLIHLFFRLRTKRVELGTIRFLRIVLEENARRRKVMRWFLLALRMACIALLVSLFARPYFSEAAINADKDLHVLLVDQSATMHVKGDGTRPIDQAVAEAKRLVESLGDKSRVEIAFFDHEVHPFKPSTDASGGGWESRRDNPASQYGATSFGAGMAWARDVLASAPPGLKHFHLFTDLQRSGLDWSDVEPLPPDVSSHLHNYSRAVVNNVAVVEIRTPRSWVRPGESAHVSATILHGGAFALEAAPIVLEIGKIPTSEATAEDRSSEAGVRFDFARLTGRITQRERAKLEPGSSVTVEFDLPPLSEGEWQGRVTVEYDDDLVFDNQRFFAISAAPAYRVLVVNGEESSRGGIADTHFLETSLRLAPPDESFAESPFAPEVVMVEDGAPLPALGSYAAVVLANVGGLSSEAAEQLAAFVRSGGGLVVFTGQKTTAESIATLDRAGVGAGTLGEIRSTTDLPWRIAQWDRKHPIFQPFSDPQSGDLRRLIFAAYTRLTPAPDAQVLAEFDAGDPAIVGRTVGDGSVLWVTTSCGRDWSNWTTTRLFLPIVHQLLGYEVGLTAGGRVRNGLIDGARASDLAAAAEASEEAVATPKPVAPASSSAKIPGVVLHDRFVEVTNTSPRESETEACTPQDFENRFAMAFVDENAASEAPAQPQIVDERKDEQWHWVACVLLGLLLLEGFVGNRTTA
jgi:hypothetical protein